MILPENRFALFGITLWPVPALRGNLAGKIWSDQFPFGNVSSSSATIQNINRRRTGMFSARWQIDAKFGNKQRVLDLMRQWERDIGSQVGLADMKFQIMTGSIGARE